MKKIHKDISNYYSKKIRTYGATPQGVDWNGDESQIIRFVQLSKIISQDGFSINDIGCGYGKYSEYLSQHYNDFIYNGYDLSKEMTDHAKKIYPYHLFKTIGSLNEVHEAEYSIASGIFSVRMKHNEDQWLSYILKTLEDINNKSLKGFSFNMLTKYSDKEYMRNDLYYADPLFIFDYCKKKFSKNVTLLHDYNLYEFTILVRKVL